MSAEVTAQQYQAGQHVRDSLFRAMPHETQVEKAAIYLKLAGLIRNTPPQGSFSYLVDAFRISVVENNDSLKAMSRLMMGDNYNMRRKFIQAQEQYLAALNAFHSVGDTANELQALIKIGIINRFLDKNDKALCYFQKGMSLAKGEKTSPLRGSLLEQIALTYQGMKDYEAAIYFFRQAHSLFSKTRDTGNIFRMQAHIGNVFLDEGRNDEALVIFDRLLRDAGTSDLELLGILDLRIARVYSAKQDHRASLKYDLKALEISRRRQAKAETATSMINAAGDYYNLDLPDSAKPLMDSGLILASGPDQKHLLETGYHHLFVYFRRTGNFKEALKYYSKYSLMHDGIIREQNRNNIEVLEINQQLQRIHQSGRMISRQRDILSLNLKYHNFQSAFLKILLGMTGVSMVIFLILLIYIRRVRRQMQELNIHLFDEIRGREITEKQTSEHENQYKFLTDNTGDFITHIDSSKIPTYASSASLRFFGYKPAEILERSLPDLVHPDYHTLIKSKFDEMVATRSSKQFTYQALKKDGTVFWVESIWNPLFDPINGVFTGMVGVTRDIHERKTKEFEIMEGTKHTENLLKEIHHRVKNNFAILVSLINMQMGQTKNEELLHSLTNLQLRIRTMSLVHEMLYRSGDFEKISFPGYLRSLASVIAGTYNRHDIRLIIEADEMVMDIETSIPIGLIVNEILSNSYKHAFPGGKAGKILIRFTMDRDTGISTLVLQDDGIGMPEGIKIEQFKTMGLQVVQILCAQIEGTMHVTSNPGASFTITFRLTAKQM